MTNEFAYYLGFLAADGWISHNNLGFALKREDRAMVEYIADITSRYSGKYIEVQDYESKCKDKYYPCSRFTITSKEYKELLAKFGIVQAKSYKDINFLDYIPDVNKDAFIIGYFDGDGGISYTSRRTGGRYDGFNISFTARKIMIDTLIDHLGGDWNVWQVKDTDTWVMQIGSKLRAKFFIDFYIKNSQGLFVLQRKLEKMKLVQEDIETKRNNLYINRSYNKNTADKIYDTYRTKIPCPICGELMLPRSSTCKVCLTEIQRKHIPESDVLAELIAEYNMTEIGRMYNVAGNTVKSWLEFRGLYERKQSDYKSTSIKQVLETFSKTFELKKTGEILNIPEWKVSDTLLLHFPEYKILIETGKRCKAHINGHWIVFGSTRKAGSYIDKPHGHIISNINGKRATAYGYRWYSSDNNEYIEYLKSDYNDTEESRIYKKLLECIDSTPESLEIDTNTESEVSLIPEGVDPADLL